MLEGIVLCSCRGTSGQQSSSVKGWDIICSPRRAMARGSGGTRRTVQALTIVFRYCDPWALVEEALCRGCNLASFFD